MGIQTSNRWPSNRSSFTIDRLMIPMPDLMNSIGSPPTLRHTHPNPACASSSPRAATDGQTRRHQAHVRLHQPKNRTPLLVVLDTGAILPTEKGRNANADSDAFPHTRQYSSLDEPTRLPSTTLDGP